MLSIGSSVTEFWRCLEAQAVSKIRITIVLKSIIVCRSTMGQPFSWDSLSWNFIARFPRCGTPCTGGFHRGDFAGTCHVELLFAFAHVSSADFHPLEIDRFFIEAGIGHFAIFAAGMSKPAFSKVDTDMGDAFAAFVLRTKEDEVSIDEVVVSDPFAHLCLIPGNPGDAYAHLPIDIVSQSGAVKSIWSFFCPDIGFIQIFIEKFLNIFSIGMACFGGFDDVVIGIAVGFGRASSKK